MKLRNIIFLLSCAVVLPKMGYGMEEGPPKEQALTIEGPQKTQAEKDLEQIKGMTEAQKYFATVKEILSKKRDELKEFGTTEGGKRELEDLQEEIQGLERDKANLERGSYSRSKSREEMEPRRSKKVWGVPEESQPYVGLAMAAAIIGAGYLYKKAPQWRKDAVKGIMHEHGKKLSDATPAERDLLMAAYTRFIPSLVASFRFKRAAARMPLDQEFSEELWPVLYHLYYGKQKTTRKQKRELKRMYDDAREQVRAAAQKIAHNKRRRRVKRKVA